MPQQIEKGRPWPDGRLLDLFGIELPILQAPMAGSQLAELALAVSRAGGLGAIASATLSADRLREEIGIFRSRGRAPLNVNFFAHRTPEPDAMREEKWRERLAPYYAELGLSLPAAAPASARAPFGEEFCALVEEFRPEIVSFHFGLPESPLLQRVRASGARIISSATTLAEARFLAGAGCDAIIAQGIEAGGHRGMFLSKDLASQIGTLALIPQIVDAVSVPVIAAGGISDARAIVAALALGASAVQLGTAYLRTPEATTAPLHRRALASSRVETTAITNLFTGRPARGIDNRLIREIGPISEATPEFPLAISALAPLRTKAEAMGSDDFSSLWAGQAAALAREMPAEELTHMLGREALLLLKKPRTVPLAADSQRDANR